MKALDTAIRQHIINDRQNSNYDTSNESKALDTIVGASVFNRPTFVTKYNGDFDASNGYPSIAYFTDSMEKDGFRGRDELYIHIRDTDQDRLDEIGERIVDILTLPFVSCSTFVRPASEGVNIGMIRLERDQDGVIAKPRCFEKTLKFYTLYTRRK